MLATIEDVLMQVLAWTCCASVPVALITGVWEAVRRSNRRQTGGDSCSQ